MNEAIEKTTVIGLGNMGGSIAARLAATGGCTGYDLSGAIRHRAATEDGVEVFDTLAEAVSGADRILTSLPNSAIVRAVWLGEDGLLAHAEDSATLIELSTIDPDTMRELAATATERGFRVVDSPVSGGPAEARNGTLSLMVGGEDEAVEGSRAVLERFGSVSRTGPAGTGKVVKIVNNMMSMGNVLVAAEAFAVGVAAGVDPQRLYDILSVSGGRSQHFTKRFPKALAGNFDPGFTLELGEKDLALGVELARTLHLPAPAASTARDMYALALVEGFAGKDIVSLLALYERWASEGNR